MSNLFSNIFQFQGIGVDQWDTHSVTNMSFMFRNTPITTIDLTPGKGGNPNIWNTGAVTDMSRMFLYCSQFQGVGLTNWNIHSVENMFTMFYNCAQFNGTGLQSWDTHSVFNFSNMFTNSGFNADISGWNLSNAFALDGMFDNCPLSARNYSSILNGWYARNSGGTIPTGVTLGAQGCNYLSNAGISRTNLINSYQWNIVGDSFFLSQIVLFFNNIPQNALMHIPINGIISNVTLVFSDGTPTITVTPPSVDYPPFTVNSTSVTVTITGGFSGFGSQPGGAAWLGNQYLISVESWAGITNFYHGFEQCVNLETVPTQLPTDNTSNEIVTDTRYMFYQASKFTGLGMIENWATSLVTNMSRMFYQTKLGAVDLTPNKGGNAKIWNTGAVQDMAQMFYSCSQFQGIGVDKWDTHNVTDLYQMLINCPKLSPTFSPKTNGNIWNTSSVTNFTNVFANSSFNADISSWNLSSATEIESIISLTNLSSTNYSNILKGWASQAPHIPQNVGFLPYGLAYDTSAISARNLLLQTYGWDMTGDLPVSVNGSSIQLEFKNIPPGALFQLPLTAHSTPITVTFSDATPTLTIEANYPYTPTFSVLSNNVIMNITGGFAGFSNLMLVQGFRSTWLGSQYLTSVNSWSGIQQFFASFIECYQLTSIPNVLPVDSNNNDIVIDTRYMFISINRIQPINASVIQSIGQWNTSSITTMVGMFAYSLIGAIDLTPNKGGNPKIWNTSNLKNANFLFFNCYDFQGIGVDKWDTHSVTNMAQMFQGCQSLQNFNPQPNGPIWNTAQNQYFAYMFTGSNFNADISGWNLSSAFVLDSMFDSCSLSTQNYSNILIGWNNRNSGGILPSNLNLGAQGCSYSSAAVAARDNLLSQYHWNITGDSPAVPSTLVLRFVTGDTSFEIVEYKTFDFQLPVNLYDSEVIVTFTDTGAVNPPVTISQAYSQAPTIISVTTRTRIITMSLVGGFKQFGTGSKTTWLGSQYLESVQSWSGITSFSGAFTGCTALVTVPNQLPLNQSQESIVTNTSYMFYGATAFTGYQQVETWKTSKLVNTSFMFSGSGLNSQVRLTPNQDVWNTSKVYYMTGMFANLKGSFNGAGVDQWDTSQVRNLDYFFYGCKNLTNDSFNPQYNNSYITYTWNLNYVTSMISMFENSTFDADIGSWYLRSIVYMNHMLDNCSISINNYSSTIQQLGNQIGTFRPIPTHVTFGAAGCQYLASATQQHNLLTSAPYYWTIVGDQLAPPSSIVLHFTGIDLVHYPYIQPPISNVFGQVTLSFDDSTPSVTITQPFPNYPPIQVHSANVVVTISGNFLQFGVGNINQPWQGSQYLTSVSSWSGITSFNSAFCNCIHFTSVPTQLPAQSNGQCLITDTGNMFYGCTAFTGVGSIELWDTSKIINMQGMFFNCGLTDVDLTPNKIGYSNCWNTSKVTSMNDMFHFDILNTQSTFTGRGVNLWNTSNVQTMDNMFNGCQQLTNFNPQPNGNIWNTSKVISMYATFANSNFNADISGWNLTGIVTNRVLTYTMGQLFDNCQLTTANYSSILKGWSLYPVPTFQFILGAANCCYAADRQTIAARSTLISKGWNIVGDTKASSIVLTFQYITQNNFALPIEGYFSPILVTFDDNITPPVTITKPYSQGDTFFSVKTLKQITMTVTGGFTQFGSNSTASFSTITWLGSKFLTSVSSWSGITRFTNAFYSCNNLISLPHQLPVDDNNNSIVTHTDRMLIYCNSFTGVGSIENWDTSQVVNMDSMFLDSGIGDVDLSPGKPGQPNSWNTQNVVIMNRMFMIDSNGSSNSFTGRGVASWNTSSVTRMINMFYNCHSLVNFNPQMNGNIWNTANVTSMSGIFYNSNFNSSAPGSWNIQSCRDMRNIFDYSALSRANYDSILNAWSQSAYTIPRNISLGAYQIAYSAASYNARNLLRSSYGWSFVGDFSNGIILLFNNMVAHQTQIQLPIDGIATGETVYAEFIYSSGNQVYAITQNYPATPFVIVSESDVTVYIHGNFNHFGLPDTINNSPPTSGWLGVRNLRSVQKWEGITSFRKSFPFGELLQTLPTKLPTDTTGNGIVTDTSYMLYSCPLFSGYGVIENWDTFAVTNMEFMFTNCISLYNFSNFSSLDLTRGKNGNPRIWNTQSVTNMQHMFAGCTSFAGSNLIIPNQLGITTWYTGNVTNMQYMFSGCKSLGALLPWDVSQVTNMEGMFLNAYNSQNESFASWNPVNVTNFSSMFRFTNFDPFGIAMWNSISNATNLLNMLDTTLLSVTEYSAIINHFDTIVSASGKPNHVTIGVSGLLYNQSAVAARNHLISQYGWTFAGDSLYIQGNNSIVLYFEITAPPLGGVSIKLPVKGVRGVISVTGSDGKKITILNDYPNVPVYVANTSLTITVQGIFSAFGNYDLRHNVGWEGGTYLKSVVSWNGSITNWSGAFFNCSQLNQVPSTLPNNQCTNLSYMFYGATQLNFNPQPNTSSNHWNTSSVKNMQGMFAYSGLNNSQFIPYWNIQNVTNMQNFLDRSAMTYQNYGILLLQIDNLQNLPRNIVFGAQGMYYNNEPKTVSHRNNIINRYGWQFVGDASFNETSIILQFTNPPFITLGLPIRNIINPVTVSFLVTDYSILIPSVTITQDYPNTQYIPVNYANVQVMITGNFTQFGYGDVTSQPWVGSEYLTKVVIWFNMTSLNGAFMGCRNLTTIPSNIPTSVTNLSKLFYMPLIKNETLINGVSTWDVSRITDMSYMFTNCNVFRDDLSSWNTQAVTNMQHMFDGCTEFEGRGVQNFNTHLVTNMSSMFQDCRFLSPDLNLTHNNYVWDVTSVTDMQSMFDNSSFTGLGCNTWNTQNVTNMLFMFYGSNFNTDISGWLPIQAPSLLQGPDMRQIFSYTKLSPTNYSNIITGWYYRYKNLEIGADGVQYYKYIIPKRNYLQTYKGWSILYDSPYPYETTITLQFDNMIPGYTTFTIPIVATQYPVYVTFSDGITSPISTNQPITYTATQPSVQITITGGFTEFNLQSNTSCSYYLTKVIDWFGIQSLSYAFYNCKNLTSLPNYLPKDASNNTSVTNMSFMFYQDRGPNFSFTGQGIIENWDTTPVTNMKGMFLNSLINCNLANWNIQNVTNMQNMFDNSYMTMENYSATLQGWASHIGRIPSNIPVGAYTMYYTPAASTARQTLIDTYGWQLENDNLFTGATITLQFTNLIPNVTQIRLPIKRVFGNVTIISSDGTVIQYSQQNYPNNPVLIPKLATVTVKAIGDFTQFGNGDVDTVQSWPGSQYLSTVNWFNIFYFPGGFMGCINLTNFSSMTSRYQYVIDASHMFDMQQANTGQPVFNEMNFERLLNAAYMFAYCNILATANLSSLFTFNSIINMQGMFYSSPTFSGLGIDSLNTSNTNNMAFMFANCTGMNPSTNFSNTGIIWNTQYVTDMQSMFLSTPIQGIGLNTWNTLHVQNMNSMLENTRNFNQNLGSWLIYGIQSGNMRNMFDGSGLSSDSLLNSLKAWIQYPTQETPVTFLSYFPKNVTLGYTGITISQTWPNTLIRTIIKKYYDWTFQEYNATYAPLIQAQVDLSYNTPYTFAVQVNTNIGSSTFSPPSAPPFHLTNQISGPPGQPTLTQQSTTPTVKISWAAPQNLNGSTVQSYWIVIQTATDKEIIQTQSAATTATVTISYGVAYTFSIIAETNIGISQASPTTSFQLATGKCSAPTNLTYTIFQIK